MPNTIQITVVAKDGVYYADCPKLYHLPCPASGIGQIDATDYWVNSDACQNGFEIPPSLSAPVAPAVGFRVARIVLENGTELLAIADLGEGDTPQQLIADACDSCCDPDASPPQGEPVVAATPDSIIPVLAPVNAGQADQDCATGDCTYTYEDQLPDDSEGLKYKVSFNCNGSIQTSADVTTIAGALAAAQAFTGITGTWSLNGNILTLTGSNCPTGVIRHILQNQTFTLDFSNAGTDKFNQVKNNGFLISLGQTLTASDMATLITVLQPYFGDGTLSVSSEANNTIQYVGTGKPNDVELNGVVVSTWS